VSRHIRLCIHIIYIYIYIYTCIYIYMLSVTTNTVNVSLPFLSKRCSSHVFYVSSSFPFANVFFTRPPFLFHFQRFFFVSTGSLPFLLPFPTFLCHLFTVSTVFIISLPYLYRFFVVSFPCLLFCYRFFTVSVTIFVHVQQIQKMVKKCSQRFL
jgi:hypothetical protein